VIVVSVVIVSRPIEIENFSFLADPHKTCTIRPISRSPSRAAAINVFGNRLILLRILLCRGRDSNPHGAFAPEDFKTLRHPRKNANEYGLIAIF
jgi:hypothetical protein